MRLVAGALLGLLACQKTRVAPEGAGTYSVPGLSSLAERPLVILNETSAWSGSREDLPAVVVYESGLVISVGPDPHDPGKSVLTSSRLDAPASLVADFERAGLGRLYPYLSLNNATDQPIVSISYRVGEAWHDTAIEGLGVGLPQDRAPPAVFMEALLGLHHLPTHDARRFAPPEYRVDLSDDTAPTPILDWPVGVPAPPPLVPNERYVGRPRSYLAPSDAGAELYALVHDAGSAPKLRVPTGETPRVWVHMTIPSLDYIRRVGSCSSSEALPFHVCDR